jgi:phosphopantothenoylcysteine decarboxylase/phosphopantothenate--cysteine ligase
MALELVANPDLLAEVGAARVARTEGDARRPVLVGFAVETDTDEGVVASARGKLTQKRVDMVVANHAADAFGRDDNRATIVTGGAADALGILSKAELADRILDRVATLWRR